MGFNLGLAATAYNASRDEQRRIQQEEFSKAQQDYALARLEEHKARRVVRDNAANLENEQITQRRTLLPGQTALAQKEQSVQSSALDARAGDLAFAEKLRPVKEKAGLLDAEAGAMNAETNHENAQDVRKWSPLMRTLNAKKIDLAIANGELEFNNTQEKVLASLYESGTSGKMDENAIIHRLNGIAESSLFPELNGKTVADIELKGDVMDIRDASGTSIAQIPMERMKAAHAKHNPGQIMTMADGVNAYRKNTDGSLEKLTNNTKSFNPNSGGRGSGGAGAVLDRFAADLMDEAKANGKPISAAEAKRRASYMLKSNPGGWAQRMLQNNLEYQMEKDPAKRQEMETEALQSAQGLASAVGGGAKLSTSGLEQASPESQAKVRSFLGL